MSLVKQFSRVRLKDGGEGVVMDIYTKPRLGYEIDFYVNYPQEPCPDPWFQAVGAEEIAEIL